MRHPALICALLLAGPACSTEEFGECRYFPKPTEQEPYPGWEMFKGCAPAPTEGEHIPLEGGVWGFIDKDGREIVQVRYTAAELYDK